ncbi:hypothetical protein QQ054_27085 [Oscillatoria amoena NRMC-F 0135]|nr:hypothetical protein [Oscillatoria amoena NRMC-F 0135]
MKNRVIQLVFAALVVFAASCSKADETVAPVETSAKTTWITYTHTVADEHGHIPYSVEYVDQKGIKKLVDLTGSFTVRVPVMRFDSAGVSYIRTAFTFKTSASDGEEAPLINSAVKIKGDNGFVVAETYLSSNGCGNNHRTVSETRPLSVLQVKF